MTEPEQTGCVICHRRQPRHGFTCDADVDRMIRDLGEIIRLHGLLGDQPDEPETPWTVLQLRPRKDGEKRWVREPGHDPVSAELPTHANGAAVGGQHVSGSREAPLPVRVDTIDLTLPANVSPLRPDRRGVIWIDDQTGRVSAATILDTWARDWADGRGLGEYLPAATVPALAAWLANRTDWAGEHHPAIDEYAKEIRDLLGALRAAVGETSDKMRLGPCPVMLDDGPCGAGLYGSPWVDIVECPRCATRWEKRQWFVLGAAIRQAKADAA